MRPTLRLLSSMATKPLLQELAQDRILPLDIELELESVGGVVAKARIEQGEDFDLVCLASDALDALEQSGQVVKGSVQAFAWSDVAVAIAEGRQAPALETEADLKAAVLGAKTIGYSTGPSGKAVLALLSGWGILEQVSDRLVQAKAGVPVAASIAAGSVELGFQQLSEMLGVPGIQVLGTLPAACRIQTCFSLGLVQAGKQHALSQKVQALLTDADTAAIKQAQGMRAP